MKGDDKSIERREDATVPKEELYPNSTQFPNLLLDEIWPLLTPQEAMVLAVAVRKTLGWQKREEAIALSQFCEGTGLRRKAVQKALKVLEAVNLIIVLRWQADGKVYTLNIWEEMDRGPIHLNMLRGRKGQRAQTARKRTEKATQKRISSREILRTSHDLKDVTRPDTKVVARPKGKVVTRPTQKPTIKPIKHKGDEKRHPDHQHLMAVYRQRILEDEGLEKLSAPGKENLGAQKILEMGFTAEEGMGCYLHFKQEPFWRDKHLSLAYIAQHISAWREGKGEAHQRVLGKPGVSQAQRDYYSAHLDPKD